VNFFEKKTRMGKKNFEMKHEIQLYEGATKSAHSWKGKHFQRKK
jgi:hypothetical protein